MSGKNQFPSTFNWQATDPRLTLFPLPANQTGSVPSGVTTGTMSGANTIYSNIIDVSKLDNLSLHVSWTGTPTGTITLLSSNALVNTTNWPALTFTYQNPVGVDGYQLLNINQKPFKYLMVSYTNSTGTGALTIFNQMGDLN